MVSRKLLVLGGTLLLLVCLVLFFTKPPPPPPPSATLNQQIVNDDKPLELIDLTRNYKEEEEEEEDGDGFISDKLMARKQRIRQICKDKGFKQTDRPIHEDSEKPSLYQFTALDLFICMLVLLIFRSFFT